MNRQKALLIALPLMASFAQGAEPVDESAAYPTDIDQYRYYSYPDLSREESRSFEELLKQEPTAGGPEAVDIPKSYHAYDSYPQIDPKTLD